MKLANKNNLNYKILMSNNKKVWMKKNNKNNKQ